MKHHKKVDDNKRRLRLTRAEFIGLLIDKFADVVALPGKDQKYESLRDAIGVLGGRLERRGFGGPRGETWVLSWDGTPLLIESNGKTFPLLDACYANQNVATEEHYRIDPGGVAELLSRLATP